MQILDNNPILQTLAINSLLGNIYYYCKDNNSNYLHCNDQVANALNLTSPQDIANRTDHDFGWTKQRIHQLHLSDRHVIFNAAPASKLEDPFVLPNGKEVQLLSHKMPMYDEQSKIIGIVGISIDINQQNKKSNAAINALFTDPVNALQDKLKSATTHKISRREAECLHYLMQGKTAREIALLLFLSPRTVELYLSNLKEKFDCRKKSELIGKVLNLLN